ncbi:MAG: hypothetical protein IPG04_10120 [Polyangiaceae bacterium]|nr:hypothetical protein [Polyangiaceae bacterium]
MNLRDTITTWVDERLREMLAAPRMWGSLEAVEMQALLLLELRALALRPETLLGEPRLVIDGYASFLREKFPQLAPGPAFQLLANDEAQVRDLLESFVVLQRQVIAEETAFERSALAIRLTFSTSNARAGAVATYYDSFRHAVRAVARPSAKARRNREVEAATDFDLEEAVVSPANGKPASVTLRLNVPEGQQSFLISQSAAQLFTMLEWAATDDALDSLGISDRDARVRTALQARRVLPRGAIAEAEIGGRWLNRLKPTRLVPGFERRLLDVVSDDIEPTPFTERGEIRAIDLDRGAIRLASKLQMFVAPEELSEINQVGVIAEVVGQRYQPPGGNAFVLVDEVTLDAGDGTAEP